MARQPRFATTPNREADLALIFDRSFCISVGIMRLREFDSERKCVRYNSWGSSRCALVARFWRCLTFDMSGRNRQAALGPE